MRLKEWLHMTEKEADRTFKNKISQKWWYMPIISATQEGEMGGYKSKVLTGDT